MQIPFAENWYRNAIQEQKMRSPYMRTKFADSEARREGQIRGLVIEHHVSGWFKQNFRRYYLEPDNYKQWTKMCPHDFKLKINGKIYRIDISGPRKNGTFGTYSEKPHYGVDYHILAKPLGLKSWNNVDYRKGFEIIGVIAARDFKQKIDKSRIIPFENWLKTIKLI